MFSRFLPAIVIGVLLCAAVPVAAQDIDTLVTTTNRNPSTVADQISNPAERAAFLDLYKLQDAGAMLQAAKSFLQSYPQSAFLAQAYEVAADSSFDQADYVAGLEYARQSLAYLPENSQLLVAVADVQARQHLNDEAIASAQAALYNFDRFGRPGAIAEGEWPDLKRRLRATANFALGRALLQLAVAAPAGEQRTVRLKESEQALVQARTLNPQDWEIVYVLGLARLSSSDFQSAASAFAEVYRQKGALTSKALEHLQTIYKTLDPKTRGDFESFVQHATDSKPEESNQTSPPEKPAVAQNLPAYAGSESCRGCHGGVYRNWSQSGMSKMFRAYAPQNVIGDFTENNQFFAGDEAEYQDGKLQMVRGANRSPFARMELRDGKHYFNIFESDGQWHTYPVDYTIGSKWQQAYATKLPSGEIHVFPIQYSAIEKQWLNYWKVIDSPGSPRADLHAWEKLNATTSYQAVCAVCHTSQLRNLKGGGFEPQNLEFRETGINCEMCHGPSAQHVASMSTGEDYKKTPLDPPVEFAKIDNRDFVAVCAQCHMQSAIRTPGPHGELNYATTGAFFLRDPMVPFGEFSRKGFYKDGRFRQTTFIVEALERSKCFQKAAVSCGSCHNPHTHDESSNRTALKLPEDPNQMCTGCHTQFKDSPKAAAHSHHSAASEASQCVSCHMPRIMDALLFRARTHQIDDIPNPDMTQRFGQSESPNACLQCHTEKSAQWVKQRIASWKAAD
ncbi:MAG: cytochrome c3 family protein [Candidatus Acidiferrales bacterium]